MSAHGLLHLQIETLTGQIEQNTNNAQLYFRRAELHRQHQDALAAAADYDRVAKLDPGLAAVDLGRGRLLSDLGRLAEAKGRLDRYLEKVPDDSEGLLARARVLARLGEGQAAANDFARAIALSPDPQPDYYLERSQALMAQGDSAAALAGLEEGIAKLGSLLTLQQAALEIEIATQKLDAALRRLDVIVAQVPRKEQWLAKKADLLLQMGRRAEAAETYRAATAAIQALPPRLRENPSIVQLQNRIEAALKLLAANAATGTTAK
jgi:tetratricopeptide (TPR) repeat protein